MSMHSEIEDNLEKKCEVENEDFRRKRERI